MNNLEKEFVPYPEALELKELGFNEPCLGFYERDKELVIQECEITDFHFDSLQCVTPTFSQAFRWFREKYNLFGCIDLHVSTPLHWFIRIDKIDINDYLYHSEDENIQYSTYEEAELACLRKLIEIVKNTKP